MDLGTSLTIISANTTAAAIPERNPAPVFIYKEYQRRRDTTCLRERTTHCQAKGLTMREAIRPGRGSRESLVCWRAFRHGGVSYQGGIQHGTLLIRSSFIEREREPNTCTDGSVSFTIDTFLILA
jgi:hypothetical protein